MAHKLLNTQNEPRTNLKTLPVPAGSNYQPKPATVWELAWAWQFVEHTRIAARTSRSILSTPACSACCLLPFLFVCAVSFVVFHSAISIDFCSLFDFPHPSLHLATRSQHEIVLQQGQSIAEIFRCLFFPFIQLILRSPCIVR